MPDTTSRSIHTADPAALVARVYAESDRETRVHLLESLLRPLGALALMAVAGGAFAALRQRNGWASLRVTLDDAVRVNAGQVQDLATYVLQAAPDALAQLADVLTDSPVVLPSLSVLLLLQALRKLPGRHGLRRWWPLGRRSGVSAH